MMFPIIKVRDKHSGYEHILGTNSHDTLHIDDETGGLQYTNLQCMEGTTKYDEESSYDFMGKKEEWDPYTEIQFVSFDELLDIYKQQITLSCEQERFMKDMVTRFIEEEHKKNGLDEEYPA